MLIPAADDNRQMLWERQKLVADYEQIQKQVAVNDAFLKRLGSDPALAERLAQRQMRMVREGTSVMDLKGTDLRTTGSPFLLVTLPPPPPMPQYKPVGGEFAALCRQPRTQLYLIGGALLMIAVGLVLGHSNRVS